MGKVIGMGWCQLTGMVVEYDDGVDDGLVEVRF